MFRIAVCDDEPKICSQIENIILDYFDKNNLNVEVQVYYSGEELYKFLVEGEHFDLLFLDIELRMINGIEVGKRIRDDLDNQIMQIVYISGKDSYYKDLFDVRPMHFLSKPFNEIDIIKDIRLAMKLTNKLGGFFSYKIGQKKYRKPVKEIQYFENVGREIRMVTLDGEEYFYGKLDEVFKNVSKYHFMYIHKSYIVNYFYVTRFKYEEVTMANQEILPISQSKRKLTRELQMQYEKEGLE